tara:strand:- start:847 stop:1179 length:333 start_codon:yes stop_codon:yes gene_type:complete
MNDFIKKMLEHGAELDQATSTIQESVIINDAEILYERHLNELKLSTHTMTFRNSHNTKLIASYEAKGYTFTGASPTSPTETIYGFTAKNGDAIVVTRTHPSSHRSRGQFE